MDADPIDLRELGARLREYRTKRNLSMRAAAEESGAPLNTISRVERGQMPDLMNFKRLAEWIGLDPALFFRPPKFRQESTVEQVRYLLRHDDHLDDAAVEQIGSVVESLYRSLVKASLSGEAHVRVAPTLVPTAAIVVGELLTKMQAALVNDPELGAQPGW